MTTSTPLRQPLIEDMQRHGFAAKMQGRRAPHSCGNGTAGPAGGSPFRAGGAPLVGARPIAEMLEGALSAAQ